MAERFKTVHVNSKVPIRGISSPFIGIRRGVKMSIEDIGICLARGASVIEVFEDGRMQKLTPKNYRDNFFAQKTEEMNAEVEKENANVETVITGGTAGGSSSNEETVTPEETKETVAEEVTEETPTEGVEEVADETPAESEEVTEETTEETVDEETTEEAVEETPAEVETTEDETVADEDATEETPVEEEEESVEDTFNPTFDLVAAYEAANSGDTITLEGDVYLEDTLVIEKDITIELNGYEIRSAKTVFETKANVVINGEGYVAGGEGASYTCIKANTGTLTINGGHYYVGADENGEGNTTIYVNGNAIVHINDGYFETEAAYNNFWYVLNKKNNVTGSFVVNGGTFLSYNPAEGDDAASDDTFVAEGYEVIYDEEGDEYVVIESESATEVVEETTEEAGAPAEETEEDATEESTTEEDVTEETTEEDTASNIPNVTLENVDSFTKAQLTVWAEANGVDVSGMNKAAMVEAITAALKE